MNTTVAAVATNERFPNSVESEIGDMDDGMLSSSSFDSPIATGLSSSSSFENSGRGSMLDVYRKRSLIIDDDDDESFDKLMNENQDENRCPRKQARLNEQDLTNIKSIEEMLVNECSSFLATRRENNRFEAELSPSSTSRTKFDEDFFQTIELFDTSESLNQHRHHQTVEEFNLGLEDSEFNFNFQTDYFNNTIYQQTNLV